MDQMLTWLPELAVGNTTLDRQHRQLFDISEQAGRCALAADTQSDSHFHLLLNDIAVLFDRHFTEEENYLEQNACPNLEAHKAEHDHYRARLTDLLCDASIGRIDRQALHQLTCDYLREHLQKTDQTDLAVSASRQTEPTAAGGTAVEAT